MAMKPSIDNPTRIKPGYIFTKEEKTLLRKLKKEDVSKIM